MNREHVEETHMSEATRLHSLGQILGRPYPDEPTWNATARIPMTLQVRATKLR